MRYRRKENKSRWLWYLLIMGVAGCGLACSSPGLRYRPLKVAYLPYLVKGLPRHFPPHRILVLFPLDQRQGLAVREGQVPPVVRGAEIAQAQLPGREVPTGEVLPEVFYPVIGFRGTSSRGSLFVRSPSHFSPPDMPWLLFYMGDLKGTVQRALADHLGEVGLQVMVVSFSHPYGRPPDKEIQADYALSCSIEEFPLLSLFYYVAFGDLYPVLGPTGAQVALTLTLYSWPSGEQLWEGRVGETLTDPLPGDDMHIYGTMGETMSVALSSAVGSLLVTQDVQDIFFHRQAS